MTGQTVVEIAEAAVVVREAEVEGVIAAVVTDAADAEVTVDTAGTVEAAAGTRNVL